MSLREWQYHLITSFCFHVSVPKSLSHGYRLMLPRRYELISVIMHTDRNFGSINFWVQLWTATLQPGAWNSPRLLRKTPDCQAVKLHSWNYRTSYFWSGYNGRTVWSVTASAPGRHLTASQNEAPGVPLNSATATIYSQDSTWGWCL